MRKLSALIVACWLTVAPVAASAQVLDQGFINAGTACTTTGACVAAVVGQASSVTIQIVGTFSATLTFEATADGSTWVSAQVQNLADGTISTSTTAAGAFSLSNVGVQRVRVRASAYTSGGAQVTFVRGYGMVRWQGFPTLTVTDAIIVGSATTSGIRLDVSSGVFRVREGDNSADGPMSAGAGTFSGTVIGNFITSNTDIQVNNASGRILFSTRGQFSTPSDGVYRFNNWAATNPYDITLADWGTTQTAESVSMTDTQVVFLGSGLLGTVNVVNVTQSKAAVYMLRGANNATTEVSDPDGGFAVTKDSAGNVNIYYDAAGASGAGYYIQNLRGTTVSVRLTFIGG